MSGKKKNVKPSIKAEAMKKMSPEARMAEQKDPNLNDPKDWDTLHKARSAISAHASKLEAYGDKLLVTDEDLPLSRYIFFFFIIGIIFIFIIWANWAKLDEITRGQGKVIPSSQVQVIQHQEGGTVQALMVREGDTVDAGQILMRLSDVGAQSELGTTQSRMTGLQAKITRLRAEAEGADTPEFSEEMMNNAPDAVKEELDTFIANKSQIDSQTAVLRSQLQQRRSEVNEINTKIADLNRVLSLTNEEMAMIRPLVERGSAPRRDLLQLEQTLAQQRSEINGLRASLPRAQSAIAEADARLKDIETTFKTEAQNEMTSTLLEVRGLQQQVPALQDRKSRTEIRSPVRGIVKDIRIQTGDGSGVIRPGDAIMEIVPLDDQLVIEAKIKPSDVAFLHPGQKAVVKVTAYDFSIYGGLKGQLTGISADTITDQEGNSFYQIQVTTDKNSIIRNGQEFPIIPGMIASTEILTGEKTVMEFIMKPIFKTWDQALNER